MKVFISWSGDRSHAVAEALHIWLPNVIQGLQPWLSSNDIDKGARWATDIASQLEQSRIGIICLTPENLEAPWLLFEAGALSKFIGQTFVCPFLVDLEPTDIKGPLVQFQATKSDKEDTRKLMLAINRAQNESSLPEDRINAAFEKWWPDLAQQLQNLPTPELSVSGVRSERDMIQELLTIARGFQRKERTASNDVNKLEKALNNIAQQLKGLVRR